MSNSSDNSNHHPLASLLTSESHVLDDHRTTEVSVPAPPQWYQEITAADDDYYEQIGAVLLPTKQDQVSAATTTTTTTLEQESFYRHQEIVAEETRVNARTSEDEHHLGSTVESSADDASEFGVEQERSHIDRDALARYIGSLKDSDAVAKAVEQFSDENVITNINEFKQAASAIPLRSFFQELSADQDRMVQDLWEFFQSDDQVFLLKGYAGTGKTFLIRGVAQYLAALHVLFSGCAPTGKAAQVMVQKARIETAATIHKTIYTFRFVDASEAQHNKTKTKIEKQVDSNEILRPQSNLVTLGVVTKGELPACFVLFVDESSMIADQVGTEEHFVCGSGKLLSDIFEFLDLANNPGHKVIFIGDGAQLPPVIGGFSPALSEKYLLEHFASSVKSAELHNIVRQKAQSAIMQSACFLRSKIETKSYQSLSLTIRSPEVEQSNNIEASLKQLKQLYLEDLTHGQMPKVTLLCYTNKQALEYNLKLRSLIFGVPEASCAEENDIRVMLEQAEKGQEKEVRLALVTLLSRYKSRIWLSPLDLVDGDMLLVLRNNFHFNFYNGQLLILRSYDRDSVEVHEVPVQYSNKDTGQKQSVMVPLRFVQAKVLESSDADKWHEKDVMLLTNALYSYGAGISNFESKALYLDFKMRFPKLKPNTEDFKRELMGDPYFNALQVHFGYALTCHKAQGSEWEHVFVDCKGRLGKDEDCFRWLYTAITRAQSKLTLLNYYGRSFISSARFADVFQKKMSPFAHEVGFSQQVRPSALKNATAAIASSNAGFENPMRLSEQKPLCAHHQVQDITAEPTNVDADICPKQPSTANLSSTSESSAAPLDNATDNKYHGQNPMVQPINEVSAKEIVGLYHNIESVVAPEPTHASTPHATSPEVRHVDSGPLVNSSAKAHVAYEETKVQEKKSPLVSKVAKEQDPMPLQQFVITPVTQSQSASLAAAPYALSDGYGHEQTSLLMHAQPQAQSKTQPMVQSVFQTVMTSASAVPAVPAAPVNAMDPTKQLEVFCQQQCALVGIADITVSYDSSHQYQEVLVCRDKQGHEMRLGVHYKGNGNYSSIVLQKSSLSNELSQTIKTLLETSLKGKNRMQLVVTKTTVSTGETAVVGSGSQAQSPISLSMLPPDMGYADYNEFLLQLHQALEANAIKVLSWEKKDTYRLRLTVHSSQKQLPAFGLEDCVSIDFSNNKKGVVTTITPVHDSDGNKPLYQAVKAVIESLD